MAQMIGDRQKEIFEFYDCEYHGLSQPHSERSKRANKVFINLLKPKDGATFLDVGFGTGLSVSIAAEQGCKATGTDISPQAIETAKKRFPHLEFIEANGEDLPFDDNSFDYITSLGSLGHYLNPEIGLREILRVAKPDAKICIVLPNYYFLFNILAVTFTGDHLFGQWQIQERLETKKGWIRFFTGNGFVIEIIKQDRFYGSFPIFKSLNPWKIFKRLIRRLLSWLTRRTSPTSSSLSPEPQAAKTLIGTKLNSLCSLC